MPLAVIPLISEGMTWIVLSGALEFALEGTMLALAIATMSKMLGIGQEIEELCRLHPELCRKRDLLGIESVPRVNITESGPSGNTKRNDVGPCNIPLYNFDMCTDQLRGQSIIVTASIPFPDVAQFDNIPPACMNLASVMGGSCTGEGPRPTPCGSACMQYTGLSGDQMGALLRVLQG